MKKFFGAALFFMCAAISTASANEADSAKFSTLLQQVVVTNRAIRNIPVSYTDVSGEQLARANKGKDIPDLLSGTPSLLTTSDAGAGIGYTTMRIRGVDATRINITLNGIPLNDAESHATFWVNTPDLASSLNDVQIQRGVGTSSNGTAAFGASVNMRTERPATDPYALLNGSYGTFNTRKLTVKTGTGLLENNTYFETRLSHISTDGYLERASVDLNSYFTQAGYLTDRTHLRLIAFGGKERTYHAWDYPSKEEMLLHGRRYNSCGYIGTDAQGRAVYYDDQTDNYLLNNVQALLDQRLSSRWNLNVGLHYTKGDGYYEQYKSGRLTEYVLPPAGFDGSGKELKTGLVRRKQMDNHFGGGIFALSYRKLNMELLWGGGLNHYTGDHFGNVIWTQSGTQSLLPNHEYYRNASRKTDGNTYLKGLFQLSSKLSAYADLQYRHVYHNISGYNDNWDYNVGAMQGLNMRKSFNFFNPKLGLNWQTEEQRAYASVAIAHKEPSRNNYTDYTTSDYFGHVAYNPFPKAERLIDYELGYSYKTTTWHAGANLYYMDYKDQFVNDGQLNNIGEAVVVNVPKSSRMGVEMEAGWTPCKFFNWSANATLSRNRIKNYTERVIDDGWYQGFIEKSYGTTTIAFSPSFMANNVFSLHYAGFDASLQSQYVSRQYLTNTERKEMSLDPYFVSNLSLAYTLAPKRFAKSVTFGFTIYNLFNEEYENNGWGATSYDNADPQRLIYYSGYAAQAGAHVLGSVSVRF